jgi:tetratricopeptide (TPR) repeat protein
MHVAGALYLAVAIAQAAAPDFDGGQPPLEDNYDDRWVTASSQHFLLYSTGGMRVARRTLEEAERARQALRLALTIDGDFPEDHRRLTLVLFTSDHLYEAVAPRTIGLFRPALNWGEDDLVLLRGAGRALVLRHELTHRLVQPVLPGAPPWLAEGLAEYFQWTESSDTSVVAGSTPETAPLQRAVRDSPFFPPLTQLLATPRTLFYGPQAPGLYSASFWLVSTINSNPDYRERFGHFLRSMARGSSAAVAWNNAFTTAATEALDRDYRVSPTRPDPLSHRISWQPPAVKISTIRPLNRAEVHVLMARLYGRAQADRAREELEGAISNDPQKAEAYALRALLDPRAPTGRQDAERAVALDPAAMLGWEALGLSLQTAASPADMTRLREVVHRLESFRESAETYCLGALLLARSGAPARALALARAAVRISPGYLRGQIALANVAARAHRDVEARVARDRARALVPDGVDPRIVERLLGRPEP